VGVVERRRIIDGSGVRRGDTVLGLASSGPHANGFSLIRKVFSQTQLRRFSRQLLIPTRIYVKPVLALAAQVPVHALAHVTGGGLARRLPSLVARRRLRVRLRPGSWRVPPIFGAIQRAGRISDAQMAQTFNMGIGMALVCRSKDAGRALRLLRAHRTLAWQIGVVE
jgi:phosphoribosylformylglycinamidine cyclo-ligase